MYSELAIRYDLVPSCISSPLATAKVGDDFPFHNLQQDFCGLTADATRLDVIWRLSIAGAGMGMTMAPTIGATVRAVPFDKVGISSGVTNMTRTIGMVLGVAILVTLFNAYTQHLMVDA